MRIASHLSLSGFCGIPFALYLLVTAAYGQSAWKAHNDHPKTRTFEHVAWTGSRFVAVNQFGEIGTSSDGERWSMQYAAFDKEVNTLIAAGNTLVAIGGRRTPDTTGIILVSTDGGTTWTDRSAVANERLYSVAWTGTLFVATGWDGLLLTSPDGTTWTRTDWGGSEDLYSVAWTGTRISVISDSGLLESPDGIQWNYRKVPGARYISKTVWIGTHFLGIRNDGSLVRSPDGIAWLEVLPGHTYHFRHLIWTGHRALAFGGGMLVTSPDGATWTEGIGRSIGSVAWSGQRFVGVGPSGGDLPLLSGGSIYTSEDGLSWRARSLGAAPHLNAVAWSGSTLIAVGDYTTFASADAVQWTLRNTGFPRETLSAVVWAGDRFLALGSDSVLASPDGIQWSSVKAIPSLLYESENLLWTGKFFVASGPAGIHSSLDGLAWRRSLVAEQFVAFTWTGTEVVAVATGGKILASPDGYNWAERRSPTERNLYAVVWTGQQLVAIGDSVVLTSPDGFAWEAHARDLPYLKAALWTGKRIVAVGQFGEVATSVDGLAWTRSVADSSVHLNAITRMGDRLVAVGNNGFIFTAPEDFSSVLRQVREPEGFPLQQEGRTLRFGLPQNHRTGSISATVFDPAGKAVLAGRKLVSHGREASLRLGSLPPGRYILELQDAALRARQPFCLGRD